jgi:hypothetical protein
VTFSIRSPLLALGALWVFVLASDDRFFPSSFLVATIAVFVYTLLAGTLLSPVVGTVLYRPVRRAVPVFSDDAERA